MQLEALFKISYGLYVISSFDKHGKKNGYIGNTVFQITAEPIQIAVCCNKNNYTSECIDHAGVFSVSILPEDTDPEIFGTFGYKSGRDIDKFTGHDHMTGITGAPILTGGMVGYIECKVLKKVDVGTHFMYIAEPVDAKILNSIKNPMTYDYYHKVRKGVAPKNASTYIDPAKLEAEAKAPAAGHTYKCNVCGYTLDPSKGDSMHGIEAGATLADLPENWVCPICGVGKGNFTEV